MWWTAAAYFASGRSPTVSRWTDKRSKFARLGLLIPEVLDVGEAFGFACAIPTHARCWFLESLDPSEASAARPAVLGLFDALRTVPAEPTAPARWYGPGRERSTWHGWLLDSLVDDPRFTVNGWRATNRCGH